MISGIYIIDNLINGKCYIGSSNDVVLRLRHHRKELRGGYHSNSYLQRSWNKYGEKSFDLRLLEKCTVKQLLKLEQKYINEHMTCIRSLGYNLNQNASGGPNKRNFNCRVKNCTNPYLAKGYCNAHYRRLRKRGLVSQKYLKYILKYTRITSKVRL